MKMHKKLFIFSLFLLLALSACTAVNIAPEVDAQAPDFELTNTNGESVKLSDHRGKVVLINFWATWCPPCRLEMPHIQSRYEMYNGDLVVLAVDQAEPAHLVKDFVFFNNLTFDPLLDFDSEVSNLYQVRGLPSSFFIDPEGTVKIVHIGVLTEAQLDQYLAEMGLSE